MFHATSKRGAAALFVAWATSLQHRRRRTSRTAPRAARYKIWWLQMKPALLLAATSETCASAGELPP
jgi:hypothetical protein